MIFSLIMQHKFFTVLLSTDPHTQLSLSLLLAYFFFRFC